MMALDWRKQMCEAATSEVARFVHAHSDFVVDADQPASFSYQLKGGTNFIIWGHYQSEPVIFKYFRPDWGAKRWRNEKACLQHFAPTGWVPEIHATVPERLIVMSCLPGRFLDQEASELDSDALVSLGHELGEAVGSLVNTPLPPIGDGYSVARDYAIMPWNSDLCEAVRFYIRLCRRDQHLSEVKVDPFYNESLSLVESHVDRISGQRHVIFHEDFHCFVHQGKLQGFFDLEMCRLGTELMQLERVFRQCSPDGVSWSSVLSSYEQKTGRTLDDDDYTFMLAMAQFYYHIRITRWGSPNKESDWVAKYLPDMKSVARRYADYVDLSTRLPSL